MVSSHLLINITIIIVLLSNISEAQISSSDSQDSIVIPITKDIGSHQYITQIGLRTPHVPTKLVVDLGGRFLWVDCHSGYESSTYRQVQCQSVQCSTASSTGPTVFATAECSKSLCKTFPENSISGVGSNSELVEDVITVGSTNGSASTVDRFLFSCGPTFLLDRLASGVQGMVGLGKNRIGLPSQLSARFNLNRKFAVCLPSSDQSDGVIFIGGGPYTVRPKRDISKSLIYTPILSKPGTESEPSSDDQYYIGVKSIKVNGIRIQLNPELLSIDSDTGVGGTKLSTIVPYTTLDSKSYNLSRVEPIQPFGFCFGTENISWNRNGPVVPNVELELQSEMVKWRIFGSNLMVPVTDQVMCLGLLDGGLEPKTAIVIGGFQSENNLLEFDLATSMLGFSSSLLNKQTSCSGFNFNPVSVDSS
ncbi:hypothetical protein MKW92_053137 [Papaver armeniacum]|nr:hypothetical protein MKW92_053137 [Papaver armeniacum]